MKTQEPPRYFSFAETVKVAVLLHFQGNLFGGRAIVHERSIENIFSSV